jgi:hypothetical protein
VNGETEPAPGLASRSRTHSRQGMHQDQSNTGELEAGSRVNEIQSSNNELIARARVVLHHLQSARNTLDDIVEEILDGRAFEDCLSPPICCFLYMLWNLDRNMDKWEEGLSRWGEGGDFNEVMIAAGFHEHPRLRLPTIEGRAGHTPQREGIRPSWDRTAKKLLYGETVCLGFWRSAPTRFQILDAFEARGWPPSVPSPWRCKKRLRDQIRLLNRGLRPGSPIRFKVYNTRPAWHPVRPDGAPS